MMLAASTGLPEHACTDCDGTGRCRIDEPGEPSAIVLCEGCDGCGLITSCCNCFGPVPVRFADDNRGHCALCVDAFERQDAAEARFHQSRRI